MKLPGFTAEASLRGATRSFIGAATRSRRRAGRNVDAQLRGGVWRPPLGGGGQFGMGDYWTCRDSCERARSACLDTCEGTIDNPKPSRNCMLCDDDYRACMRICTRDIA